MGNKYESLFSHLDASLFGAFSPEVPDGDGKKTRLSELARVGPNIPGSVLDFPIIFLNQGYLDSYKTFPPNTLTDNL